MKQKLLFHPELLSQDRLRKFGAFSDILNLKGMQRPKSKDRKPTDKMSIIRALIFRNLHGLPALTDLKIELLRATLFSLYFGIRAWYYSTSREILSFFKK